MTNQKLRFVALTYGPYQELTCRWKEKSFFHRFRHFDSTMMPTYRSRDLAIFVWMTATAMTEQQKRLHVLHALHMQTVQYYYLRTCTCMFALTAHNIMLFATHSIL